MSPSFFDANILIRFAIGRQVQVRQVFVGFQHHLYDVGIKGGTGLASS